MHVDIACGWQSAGSNNVLGGNAPWFFMPNLLFDHCGGLIVTLSVANCQSSQQSFTSKHWIHGNWLLSIIFVKKKR